ncbi:hypothetical protein SLEP1_g47499 [Rubroshorea leprosula]|uniref:DUF4219 domain-containing protein n=1 Tax=Rubroshorea leprosula TaxID=152421 RepID=A0AAV5LQU1_9ROSI|nr:hypothetical protein SLEP1_g47499 [Rubroshorea leprosula]
MEANQVPLVPSSNAGIAACMIVPEVLKEDNYERWCIFMQHYLVAQNLWDVVISRKMPHAHGEDPKEWIKRNALALHTIKISCGAEKFDRIKKKNSAKDAWNALANLHKQPNEGGNKDTGIRIERKQAVTLLKDIKKGDSDAVKKLFETHPPYSAALENGSTALHVAITTGKINLAKKLISVMSEEELETQDKSGETVLSLAARKGSREIVECLVGKNKKLLEIPDCEKNIPLVLACATRHQSLTRYLYSVTPEEFLDPGNGDDHGFFFLKECIRNHMFGRSLAYDHLKYAREMVLFICEQLSTLERDQFMRSGAVEATFKAIKLGDLDFVKQITEANPDIVWNLGPERSRDMLMYAVAHRQKEIAKFLYGLNVWRNMSDDDQNNILHLAAKSAPSFPHIHHFSDPFLQMKSEATWFKRSGWPPRLL